MKKIRSFVSSVLSEAADAIAPEPEPMKLDWIGWTLAGGLVAFALFAHLFGAEAQARLEAMEADLKDLRRQKSN